jgi:hypothetical protein
MATTTPNFGWPVPTSTDLVKNGATAIEALGDAIDASLVDLEGGTTGQVLAKASNTDMDFAWVAQDDSNAIQNSIVNAKGDLIGASANDVPAILSVGNNGETLVADSSTSTGLRYQGNFAAGKNKVINGDFGIWQRGTSFTATPYGTRYADRYLGGTDGSGVTRTVSQQTFTPGTAPVSGYEGQFFLRVNQSVAGTGSGFNVLDTQIEDVRTFAGQTVTFSVWLKADAARTVTGTITQIFGSGGSGGVDTSLGSFSVTTSWTRFSATVAIPSITGKTIGSSSNLVVRLGLPLNTVMTIDTWGWQLEASNTATAFQTATGTLQGELSACMRYYEKSYDPTAAPGAVGNNSVVIDGQLRCQVPVTGVAGTNRGISISSPFKVVKRTKPTVRFWDSVGNLSKYTAGNSDTSFISNNNSCDTYGGPDATQNVIWFQTVAASSAHVYCAIQWEASAEL